MKFLFRQLCSAAFLLTASVVFGANPVPNMEVVAMTGSTTVFRGFTDGKGRFDTGPLEPGVYTIEVRTVPNAPPSSARFFLSISGAKPVGEAMIGPGVAISMNAAVRRLTNIRGQVTARGGMVYFRPSVASSENKTANPRTAAPRTNAVVSPNSASALNTGQVSKSATAARPTTTNSVTALARNQPNTQTVIASSATGTVSATQLSPYPPKIVDGRPHYWIPISPGSKMGRWLPAEVARTAVSAPSIGSRPSPTPSPTPSRRRR